MQQQNYCSSVRHRCKMNCRHACSRRSPSEKPAVSKLLPPFCPLTPGLSRLVLLLLMDAAEKGKNRKSYLTDVEATQAHMLVGFCHFVTRQPVTSAAHLSHDSSSKSLFCQDCLSKWYMMTDNFTYVTSAKEVLWHPTFVCLSLKEYLVKCFWCSWYWSDFWPLVIARDHLTIYSVM